MVALANIRQGYNTSNISFKCIKMYLLKKWKNWPEILTLLNRRIKYSKILKKM